MQISSKLLQTFVKKTTLGGLISSAVLKVENKQLNIWVKTSENAIGINGTLNGVASDNVSWGIRDTKLFNNTLALFSGTIELKQDKNVLSIFDKTKQVDIILADESFIANKLEKKLELPYEKKVTIPMDIFKNIIKNKSVVTATETKVVVENNMLTISVGGKNDDKIKESLPLNYPNINAKFGAPLDDVLSVVGDKAEIGLKTDFPITMIESTPEFTILYIVAPLENPN